MTHEATLVSLYTLHIVYCAIILSDCLLRVLYFFNGKYVRGSSHVSSTLATKQRMETSLCEKYFTFGISLFSRSRRARPIPPLVGPFRRHAAPSPHTAPADEGFPRNPSRCPNPQTAAKVSACNFLKMKSYGFQMAVRPDRFFWRHEYLL